jgi:AcrR family transcriptional regulator
VSSAEASREKIFEAAKNEFAAHGVAGARVDRIAAAAGLNKNLIYVYFGDKQALFDAVIQREGDRFREAAPLDPQDLEGSAAAMFDFVEANPTLIRLAIWSRLENGPDRPLTERGVASYGRKLAALEAAQEAGGATQAMPAPALLALLYAVTQAWSIANPMGAGVTRLTPLTLAERRAAVLRAVAAILRDDGSA